MIRLQWSPIHSVADVQRMLQIAISVEFGTLPPYLYATYSMLPVSNPAVSARLDAIIRQEMIHFCLACNILNAIGGSPVIAAPLYPGPLPGDLGADGTPLTIHLLPFSPAAMQQGMDIEQPDDPHEFPVGRMMAFADGPKAISIGAFYRNIEAYLKTLPPSAWHPGNRQIGDQQYFAGQIYPVNGFADARNAIADIVSEGEGSEIGPLDFQGDLAHYYRFKEIHDDRLLTKADNPQGYVWGAPLGVDWKACYPAIADPELHDFSQDSAEARAAQSACNTSFSMMVGELNRAFNGEAARLGNAIRAMFDLRMAAHVAFTTPLADGASVAGPAFRYIPSAERASA